MSDRNCTFFRMGLRYTRRLMMMWREPLISSAFYGGLMEEVTEVGSVSGPCDHIM